MTGKLCDTIRYKGIPCSTIRCHAIQHQHQSAFKKININIIANQQEDLCILAKMPPPTYQPTYIYLSVDVFPNILLTRTLLWEAGEADKFVGTDLSSETQWRHQSIPVPVNPKDSKVYISNSFQILKRIQQISNESFCRTACRL